MFEQHHKTAFNPFLNCTKNGDIDGTCKEGLKNVCKKKTGINQVFLSAGTHLFAPRQILLLNISYPSQKPFFY